MSIESLLGLQDYGADINFLESDSITINTKIYDQGRGNLILLEGERFKNLDIARTVLEFRKWAYLAVTALTASFGTASITSTFIKDSTNTTPHPALALIGGFALRMAINTMLESNKARAQLEAVEEYFT